MKFTVLGCAGTYPGPDSPCSGYLVEHDGFRLVLDLGPGALGELQRHVGLLDIDAICLSHLHNDHVIDLVAYSYARRYHPDGIQPALPVHGPAGTAQRLREAYGAPPAPELLAVFDVHEVAPGTRRVGPFTLTSARMEHPVECHGMRLSAGGRSLVYSGDTGPCEALVELARGADLLLCEASWSHDEAAPEGIHLSGRQAGEHAARAGAAQLLLTHLVPWADAEGIEAEARAAFAGPVQRARRGMTYDV